MKPEHIVVDFNDISSSSSDSSTDSLYDFTPPRYRNNQNIFNSPIRRRPSIIEGREVECLNVHATPVFSYDGSEEVSLLSQTTETTESSFLNNIKIYNFRFIYLQIFVMWIFFAINANNNSIYDGYSDLKYLSTSGVSTFPECKDLRPEFWRLFSNVFVHKDIYHILFNSIGFLLGCFIVEKLNGWFKTLVIFYTSSYIGNLSLLFINPYVYGIGCSHSVYGLYGSLLTELIMNFDILNLNTKVYLFLLNITVIGCEIHGYMINYNEQVAYIGHWSGFLNGFLISFMVINFKIKEPWKYIVSTFFIQIYLALNIYLLYDYITNWPKLVIRNDILEPIEYDSCCLNYFKDKQELKNIDLERYICRFESSNNNIINI